MRMTSNVLLWNQHPSKPLLVFKTSSRHVFKTSWKTKNCYAEDVFRKSWRHSWRCLKDMSWRGLKDLSSRRLEDISWIRLEDILKTSWRQTKYLLGISYLTNLNVYIFDLTNLFLKKCTSDKSKANPKCIN